jgi:hypothetical protein
LNEVKPIVGREGCMMGFATLNPSYRLRSQLTGKSKAM